MPDILYLQIDRNIQITHPAVKLQDIATLNCSSSTLRNRLCVLPILSLTPGKYGRYVLTVSDVVNKIQTAEPSLLIFPVGESDFILSYQKTAGEHPVLRFGKIFLVCLISFFGGAFSIMTFNTDVGAADLFQKVYTQVTGRASNGFTVLEISYSLGIGLGVLFFFNHFGRRKLTSDPTPLQVQMRLYEDDINTTIIEALERQENSSGTPSDLHY
ncbi:MAG: stage V sporulation protein AA [Blautia sp.]|nr:stage V sporulation protein AA [Blautia sp.]